MIEFFNVLGRRKINSLTPQIKINQIEKYSRICLEFE